MSGRLKKTEQQVLKVLVWLPKLLWHTLKRFVKGGLVRSLLWIALAEAGPVLYLAWQAPPIGAWPLLRILWRDFASVFWRVILWVATGEVVRSVTGALALLGLYAFFYRFGVIREKRFISVASFRVWGSAGNTLSGEGIAARLRDEFVLLQRKIQEQPAGKIIGVEQSGFAITDPAYLSIEMQQPDVTVEYEGISPEALHAFLRRAFKRQVLITGDVIPKGVGFLIVARTERFGPWMENTIFANAAALQPALAKLAESAMIDLI